jgi:hypothetical protein
MPMLRQPEMLVYITRQTSNHYSVRDDVMSSVASLQPQYLTRKYTATFEIYLAFASNWELLVRSMQCFLELIKIGYNQLSRTVTTDAHSSLSC